MRDDDGRRGDVVVDDRAVAEATMRYAAQPAAFGIEGGVAERAALCFLAD